MIVSLLKNIARLICLYNILHCLPCTLYKNVTQSAEELYAAISVQFLALFWASIGRFFYELRTT